MQTRKHILMVGAAESALAALVPKLEAFNYGITLVRSPEEALGVETATQFSMVAIDGASTEGASHLVEELKNRTPGLPILWIGPKSGSPPRVNATVEDSAQPDAFQAAASKLLFDDFYPNFVVQSVVAAANQVLATTFNVPVELGEPTLRRSEALPYGFTSIVPFVSKELLGHALVCGEVAHLVALGLELGMAPEEDGERSVARDVAGEIANQFVGRIKITCANLFVGVQIGLPYGIVGNGVLLFQSTQKPSICVTAKDPFGTLLVDFCLERLSVADASNKAEDGFAKAGELILL